MIQRQCFEPCAGSKYTMILQQWYLAGMLLQETLLSLHFIKGVKVQVGLQIRPIKAITLSPPHRGSPNLMPS